ncbi:hypothetical protein [Saccharopolyspora taberi]|uniref:Uncharacterized protein n=1 Tax=Saccharopolyspora taberi TaxID=60895 RepID=A0ABN3UZL8_9PSEU
MTADRIAYRLHGVPCAICGLPGAFVTIGGLIHHASVVALPPCKADPLTSKPTRKP